MKLRCMIMGCVVSALSTPLAAKVCDYKPSSLIGVGPTAAVAALSSETAAVGAGAIAAGFYTFTHATSGLTMLGSTAGGASAAGTVGIMGGTGGAIGTTFSILMAPATIITATALGTGTILYEGGCYFSAERIDDFWFMSDILDGLATTQPNLYRIEMPKNASDRKLFFLISEKGEKVGYRVQDLLIENGQIVQRGNFFNRPIGLMVSQLVVPE